MERVAVTKVERRDTNVIAVSGDLLFSTVMKVRSEIEPLLKEAKESVALDLSGVTRADSSALALWLACRRQAKAQGFDVSLHHIPEGMGSVADLVGLENSLD